MVSNMPQHYMSHGSRAHVGTASVPHGRSYLKRLSVYTRGTYQPNKHNTTQQWLDWMFMANKHTGMSTHTNAPDILIVPVVHTAGQYAQRAAANRHPCYATAAKHNHSAKDIRRTTHYSLHCDRHLRPTANPQWTTHPPPHLQTQTIPTR